MTRNLNGVDFYAILSRFSDFTVMTSPSGAGDDFTQLDPNAGALVIPAILTDEGTPGGTCTHCNGTVCEIADCNAGRYWTGANGKCSRRISAEMQAGIEPACNVVVQIWAQQTNVNAISATTPRNPRQLDGVKAGERIAQTLH